MFETICDVCKVKPAYQRVQILDSKGKRFVYMCRDCYYKRQQNATIKLMDNIAVKTVQSNQSFQSVCSKCNTTEAEFAKTSLLGCENCYRDLAKPILRMIRSAQGGFIHKGKTPYDSVTDKDIVEFENDIKFSGKFIEVKNKEVKNKEVKNIEQEKFISEEQKLKIKLEKAVEEEDFELACRLRDEINALVNKEDEDARVDEE